MRKFFTMTIVLATMFVSIAPSSAGDWRQQQRQYDDGNQALFALGLFAGAVAGAIIANNGGRYQDNGYRYERPRQHFGGQQYNPEGGWLYQGHGWRLGDGDYCRGRQLYNPRDGRKYCVR